MGKALLGPYVQSLSGKVVNQVFVRSKKTGMSYVKALPVGVTSNTARQSAIRRQTGEFARAWYSLDDENKALWGPVASANYRKSSSITIKRNLIQGSEETISAMNAMMQANSLARDVGASSMILAPQTQTLAPNGVPDLAAAFDGDKITVTWGDILNVMPSQFVRIWIKSFHRKFHLQYSDFAPGAAKTANITEVRGAKGSTITMAALVNSKVLIQVDVVDQDTGWASMPSAVVELKLTEPTP